MLVAKFVALRAMGILASARDITDAVVAALLALLVPGDTITDGGNSSYTNTLARAKLCADKELPYIYSGTNGRCGDLRRAIAW